MINKKIIGATKVDVNGKRIASLASFRLENPDALVFDSILEWSAYNAFKAARIDFDLKPVYLLQEKFRYNGEAVKAITVSPDYYLSKHDIIVDTKGFQTQQGQMRYKMLKFALHRDGKKSRIVILKDKKELIDFIIKLKYNLPI